MCTVVRIGRLRRPSRGVQRDHRAALVGCGALTTARQQPLHRAPQSLAFNARTVAARRIRTHADARKHRRGRPFGHDCRADSLGGSTAAAGGALAAAVCTRPLTCSHPCQPAPLRALPPLRNKAPQPLPPMLFYPLRVLPLSPLLLLLTQASLANDMLSRTLRFHSHAEQQS